MRGKVSCSYLPCISVPSKVLVAEERRRLGREAAAGGPVRPPEGGSTLAELRGRGGRIARRVRLLRVDEGDAHDRPDVNDGATAGRSLRKLFSKEQRALFAAYAPEGIALDDLVAPGPIFVLKLKYSPEGHDRRLVAEMWLYPDGSRILELSTKCAPAEAFQVAAETRAFLTSKGVDLDTDQQTKTRTALEFFSQNR